MEGTVQTGHVVSDLHVFAPWSVAGDHLEALQDAAARSDLFVFNGDIFDFRWRTTAAIEDAVEEAGEWLRAFPRDFPSCRFAYVLGNHDGHPLFVARLEALAEEHAHFSWHPTHVRLGDNLFLHGDLSFKYPREDPFARTLNPRFWEMNAAVRAAYGVCIALGVHRLVAGLHGRERSARQILRSFEADREGRTEGVTDVFFGHTHSAFSDFEHGGLTFHNTGSAIRGTKWNPRTFRVGNSKGGGK